MLREYAGDLRVVDLVPMQDLDHHLLREMYQSNYQMYDFP